MKMGITLFKKDVALHAVLYVLMQFGGKCDLHKISKILYFADQKHLSRYGRSITGDRYIAMQYGPVPSMVNDMFKAVRGDSYFSDTESSRELAGHFSFVNKFLVKGLHDADLDYLSESDIECLDEAIVECRDKNFSELTQMSHGLAWSNTQENRMMSYKDILRELGDDEQYADYIQDKLKLESNCFA